MKVGLDFDGTITDWYGYWIPFLQEKLGAMPVNPRGSRFHEIFDITEEDDKYIYQRYGAEYELHAPMRSNMMQALAFLESAGIDYYIVTHRDQGDMGTSRIKEWVLENIVTRYQDIDLDADHYKGVYCVSPGESKIPMLKKLGIDVMVDNDVDVISECLDNNIKAIKMQTPNNVFVHVTPYMANDGIDLEDLFDMLLEEEYKSNEDCEETVNDECASV